MGIGDTVCGLCVFNQVPQVSLILSKGREHCLDAFKAQDTFQQEKFYRDYYISEFSGSLTWLDIIPTQGDFTLLRLETHTSESG